MVSILPKQSPICGGAVSTAAVLLVAAVKLAPLAAALRENMCLHHQGRPPAVRGEKKRLRFAALIEKITEVTEGEVYWISLVPSCPIHKGAPWY